MSAGDPNPIGVGILVKAGWVYLADIHGDSKQAAMDYFRCHSAKDCEQRAILKPPNLSVMSDKFYMEYSVSETLAALVAESVIEQGVEQGVEGVEQIDASPLLTADGQQLHMFAVQMKLDDGEAWHVWLACTTEEQRAEWVQEINRVVAWDQECARKVAAWKASIGEGPGPGSGEEAKGDGQQKWEINFNELLLTQKVGAGNFGDVYKGRLWGTDVAVKILKSMNTAQALDDLKKEIAILSQLRHPNNLLYIGACTKPPNVCIVTEWCENGSLEDVITGTFQLTPQKCVQFALEIAQGMNYLHSLSPKIIHRDLKSANILVDHNFTMKVADFGLSHVRSSKEDMPMQHYGIYGTPKWMAPEVLAGKMYDEKVDVYSYGIVLCELIKRKDPLYEYNLRSYEEVRELIVDRGVRPDIPTWVHPVLREVIEQCLSRDTEKRPSFQYILTHLRATFSHWTAVDYWQASGISRLMFMLGSSDARQQQWAAEEIGSMEGEQTCVEGVSITVLPRPALSALVRRLTELLFARYEVCLAACRALVNFFARLQKIDSTKLAQSSSSLEMRRGTSHNKRESQAAFSPSASEPSLPATPGAGGAARGAAGGPAGPVSPPGSPRSKPQVMSQSMSQVASGVQWPSGSVGSGAPNHGVYLTDNVVTHQDHPHHQQQQQQQPPVENNELVAEYAVLVHQYGGVEALIGILVHQQKRGLERVGGLVPPTPTRPGRRKDSLRQRRFVSTIIKDKLQANRLELEAMQREQPEQVLSLSRSSSTTVTAPQAPQTPLQQQAHRLLFFLLGPQVLIDKLSDDQLSYIDEMLSAETQDLTVNLAKIESKVQSNRTIITSIRSRRRQLGVLQLLEEHSAYKAAKLNKARARALVSKSPHASRNLQQ